MADVTPWTREVVEAERGNQIQAIQQKLRAERLHMQIIRLPRRDGQGMGPWVHIVEDGWDFDRDTCQQCGSSVEERQPEAFASGQRRGEPLRVCTSAECPTKYLGGGAA